MAEHNHHTEDQSANNKSSIHKEDLDSSRAIDPPSNFDPIESSAEEPPAALAPEQEKYQIEWALRFTQQENAALKQRVDELQAKLLDCLAIISQREKQPDEAIGSMHTIQEKKGTRQRRHSI